MGVHTGVLGQEGTGRDPGRRGGGLHHHPHPRYTRQGRWCPPPKPNPKYNKKYLCQGIWQCKRTWLPLLSARGGDSEQSSKGLGRPETQYQFPTAHTPWTRKNGKHPLCRYRAEGQPGTTQTSPPTPATTPQPRTGLQGCTLHTHVRPHFRSRPPTHHFCVPAAQFLN